MVRCTQPLAQATGARSLCWVSRFAEREDCFLKQKVIASLEISRSRWYRWPHGKRARLAVNPKVQLHLSFVWVTAPRAE